jgi:hypothetical protein
VNPPPGGGGGAAAITVTFAESQGVVPTHAWTELGNEPSVLPAVKRPVALMVPGGLAADQTGVTVRTLPLASVTTALNCAVAPTTSVVSGATTIFAAGPAITVTVAVAVMPLQLTVIVDVPGVEPAVNNPVLVIVPPPVTAQMGFLGESTLPLLFLITTVNCCVPPTGIDAVVGEMVTVAATWGPEESPHDAVRIAANASATRTAALRARGFSVRRVSLMVLFMKLLLT